jgi:hypothetical protein
MKDACCPVGDSFVVPPLRVLRGIVVVPETQSTTGYGFLERQQIGDDSMFSNGFIFRWILSLALSGFGIYVAITRSVTIGVTVVVTALVALGLAYAGAYPVPADGQTKN